MSELCQRCGMAPAELTHVCPPIDTQVSFSSNDPTSMGREAKIAALTEELENVRAAFAAHMEACQPIYDERNSLRERLAKAERVVEAARYTRLMLLHNWSDNPNWRKGQEHTYMGLADFALEVALAALAALKG